MRFGVAMASFEDTGGDLSSLYVTALTSLGRPELANFVRLRVPAPVLGALRHDSCVKNLPYCKADQNPLTSFVPICARSYHAKISKRNASSVPKLFD